MLYLCGVIRKWSRSFYMKGLESGIKIIDESLGGLKDGKLYCIGCTVNANRTNLIAKIAMGLATRDNSVLLFSLEKNRKTMFNQLFSVLSQYDESEKSRNGIEKQSNLMAKMGEYPIWIEDTPNLSYSSLQNTIQRICYLNKHAVGVVMVDNIMQMATDFQISAAELCIKANLYLLKMVAKEYKIPVLAFTEISRNEELNRPFEVSEYIDGMLIFKSTEDDSPYLSRKGVKIITIGDGMSAEPTLFDAPQVVVKLGNEI